MFIPIDIPGVMRNNLIGAFGDDPTIPGSPGRVRRGAVRSVVKRLVVVRAPTPTTTGHLPPGAACSVGELCHPGS